MVSGVGSAAGDGQLSVKRVVLQEMVNAMVSGAGSAGDGRWSMERAALQKMVSAMVSRAGSAGVLYSVTGHWSGQSWRWSLVI